ncbi:MAG TPA: P1 family peptidase [Myxococcales bacterium]|jgi:D-aminopeptidase|nr:P1 family peptidase [Myxococcales bacterium]
MLLAVVLAETLAADAAPPRPRIGDWGVRVGILERGPLNAITDVAGVLVGHATVVRGEPLPSVNTGVTVVLPHGGNVFREKVPAAVVVGNAFGKLAGALQVNELGELESPVVLTCTLCVGKAWDATAAWLLSLPGNEEVRSVNPLIAETNDGVLNDIRQRPIAASDVLDALRGAKAGPVEEGSVGAGRGTVAFGWKGGIGTSSRKLTKKLGGWMLGALVQSNFGGILTIAGAPVGLTLGKYFLEGETGSIVIVIATDAPLDHRELERLGRRALLAVGRTGSPMTNGSGDFVVAFSTVRGAPPLPNDALSPLFEASVEATEEAIYNSLFRATTVRSAHGTVEALPLDRVRQILQRHGSAAR